MKVIIYVVELSEEISYREEKKRFRNRDDRTEPDELPVGKLECAYEHESKGRDYGRELEYNHSSTEMFFEKLFCFLYPLFGQSDMIPEFFGRARSAMISDRIIKCVRYEISQNRKQENDEWIEIAECYSKASRCRGKWTLDAHDKKNQHISMCDYPFCQQIEICEIKHASSILGRIAPVYSLVF